MLSQLLQILVPAFIGAFSAYLINQLPQLRSFRGSKFLLIALVIELAILGGILAWLFGDASKGSNARELVKVIGFVVLGAFLVNLVQLIFGSRSGRQSTQPVSPQLGTDRKAVIKGTTMKGKRNRTKITKNDVWVEDTNIDGDDQEFTVAEDFNSPSSPQQGGKQNP